MPRDAFGVYTLPPGNPVIPNTIIATNWANTTMEDIAAALTGSLSIDGSVTTAKIANSAVTTVKIADGNVTRAKLESNLQLNIVGKNYIVNGAFQLWQAATSVISITGLGRTADMCYNNSNGSSYSVSRLDWPVGQSDVPEVAKYYYRCATTSVAGAGNFNLFIFPVEYVSTLAGKQVTVSAYMRAGGSSTSIGIELLQVFGSGGSPSASVSTPMGLVTATAGAWTRVQRTVTLPSISGKTLGSNGDDYLGVIFWFDAGATFATRASGAGQKNSTIDIFGVVIEEGTAASPYIVPEIGSETLACYRQYYVNPASGAGGSPIMYSANVTTGVAYSTRFDFLIPMRAVPNVTFQDGGGSSRFPVAATVGGVTDRGGRVLKTCNSTGDGGFYSGGFIADARLT